MAQPIYVTFSGRMQLNSLPDLGEQRRFIVDATCRKRGEDLRSDDEECLTVTMRMTGCYEPGQADPNNAGAMFDAQGNPTREAAGDDSDVVDAEVEEEPEPEDISPEFSDGREVEEDTEPRALEAASVGGDE
jgi:hypothetical protein